VSENRHICLTPLLLVFALVASACVDVQVAAVAVPSAVETSALTTTTQPTTTTTEPELTTTQPRTYPLSGLVVSSADGVPLAGVTVRVGDQSVLTGSDGAFEFEGLLPGEVEVSRPVWINQTRQWDGTPTLNVELEAFVARALRVPGRIAADQAKFEELLVLAAGTTVNSLVFDTKDESDRVLYQTQVQLANDMGRVDDVYDPAELIGQAHEQGLYAITRIVTFEDPAWARFQPEAKLAGAWVDASDEANWEYPIALAVEACELGFDEIQFDYVRFPSGKTAYRARDLVPQTEEERVAAIAGFLSEAVEQLHPLGCGVSAAIFGIVLSSADDQQLGQTPEGISAVADAISPMLYPSHYDSGWLGLDNPNSHPGQVVGDALDSGMPRLTPGSLMRPWIQGFYYEADQILAQIAEAERVGAGWIIWNANGNYERAALPPAE
jgi:hypothetical protein